MNESADTKKLAQQLVAQAYPLIWGATGGKQVTRLHHKAVATVLRELAADPKKSYSPDELEQIADTLDPDESEAAA